MSVASKQNEQVNKKETQEYTALQDSIYKSSLVISAI